MRVKKNKNILICGSTGFIGRNLIEFFNQKKQFNVIGVYNKKKPIKKISNTNWVKADLRNYKDCLKVTKKIDIVIQAAATTSGSKDIINSPYLHVTDNAVMNSYLLKACYENSIKHFIFTSCTVMYPNTKKQLKEEEYDYKKIFPSYFGVANTKLYIEKMCKFYSSISNTKYSVIRHSNIYGPYDKFDTEKSHFIGSSISKAFDKKNKVKIFGKGNEKRDYLHVDDLMSFIFKSLNQKTNFEIVNCAMGKSFKIKDVMKKILIISKTKKKVVHILNSKNINVDILIDINKAKKLYKWTPKINLEKGLRKTINWYKKNYEQIL